jgi:hypothetical protein
MIRVLKNLRWDLAAMIGTIMIVTVAVMWLRFSIEAGQSLTNTELREIRTRLDELKTLRSYPRYPRPDAQYDRDLLRRELGLPPQTLPSTTKPSMGTTQPM